MNYRIAAGWISETELLSDDAYLIENFPYQSDQNRAWVRPDNEADRVRQAGTYVTDVAGYRGGFGGAEWRWTFKALSPGMVNYLCTTLFGAGGRSGEVTTYGFDRLLNQWVARQSIARLEDEAEYELEAGGYALVISFVGGRSAPDGPELTLTEQYASPFTVGVTEEFEITVRNTGDAGTYDDIVVTAALPPEYGYVSQTATGWTAEYSDDGSTWVSTPPVNTTHVRWTRTASLASLTTAPLIRLGVEPTAAGDHTLTVTAATAGVTTQTVTPTVTSNAIDLSITKTHAGSPTVGVALTWTITVENIGGAETVGEITVTDPIPADFDYLGDTNPAGWTAEYSDDGSTWVSTPPVNTTHVRWRSQAETLDALDTAQFTLDVEPTTAGTYNNEATVTTLHDVNASNDSASDEVVVV